MDANGTSAAEQPTELLHPMQEAPRAVLLLRVPLDTPRTACLDRRVQEQAVEGVSVPVVLRALKGSRALLGRTCQAVPEPSGL